MLSQKEIEKYMPYLEKFDMTNKQKRDCIEAVWFIMSQITDEPFGLTSTQLLPKKTKGESNG